MKILFIAPGSFWANNSIHIHSLANSLGKKKHHCVVLVPENSHNCFEIYREEIYYKPLSYDEFFSSQREILGEFYPDIIHCWTPRDHVREQTKIAKSRFPKSAVIIHLEDNEDYLIEAFIKYPLGILKNLHPVVQKRILIPTLSHPSFYKNFIESADGVTGIIDSLKEFVFGKTPFHLLYPIIPFKKIFRSNEEIIAIKKSYSLNHEEIILSYTGNIHQANLLEVIELYEGVKLIHESGKRIVLFRTGLDHNNLMGNFKERYAPFEKYLGLVSRKEIFDLQNISSILIQPGKDDSFNHYRLPSKIPEFLATGRPTAVPLSNIGFDLKDGINSIILKKGNRFEIVDLITQYFNNSESFELIGIQGKMFAEENFSENSVVKGLIEFYKKILTSKNSTYKS